MDGTIITKRGMQLLVKLMATKGVLTFTRVAIGTGSIPNGYDPASMIELVQYKMDGVISKCSAEEDVARITMQVSSVGIETGFIMTEMGVFASDPDIGEILYAYLDMKDDPQYIYAEGGETQKFVETTLEVAIEHATKVSTYINPSSLITKEDFDTEIEKMITPEFDDSGEVTDIINFSTFLEKIKSKMNIFDFFKNLKAGLKFVLHTGQIVNNCVSDNAELPLSAMQGKVLMDLINQTNGNLTNTIKSPGSLTLGADLDNLSVGIYQITGVKINVSGTTVTVWGTIIVCRRAFDYQQVILSNGTKAIYYRSKNESEAWTDWKQLVTNEDLPNQAVPWYSLRHDSSTSESDAVNKVNNPTLLMSFSGNVVKPYCIIFHDASGTSFLGGGTCCIFGYEYGTGEYGFQLIIKYNQLAIQSRIKSNRQWSDIKRTVMQ